MLSLIYFFCKLKFKWLKQYGTYVYKYNMIRCNLPFKKFNLFWLILTNTTHLVFFIINIVNLVVISFLLNNIKFNRIFDISVSCDLVFVALVLSFSTLFYLVWCIFLIVSIYCLYVCLCVVLVMSRRQPFVGAKDLKVHQKQFCEDLELKKNLILRQV